MSLTPIPASQILGIECKHVGYQLATDGSNDDLLLVKQVVHTKDGQKIPRIEFIENFKRPVFITKKNHRNHTDKKEYEVSDKLDRYVTTQANMSVTIQRALGRSNPNPKQRLGEACQSPYVYFADLDSATIVKAAYKRKNPDLISKSAVAVLDIETDVVFGTGLPILVSVTMGRNKVIALADWYAAKIPNLEETLHAKFKEHLSSITLKGKKGLVEHNLIEERGGDLEIIVCPTMGQGIKKVFDRVHEWMPDFLAIWNINFDLPKIIKQLEKDNIPLADVFVDPNVPDKYRKVWYKDAKTIRETNSKTISQHPADLWHVLFALSGFYTIDAMVVFKKIRVADGNEPDYKLEGVLNRHLGIGKLGFDKVSVPEGGLDWHIEMQTNWPAEYCIYNLFDCISVELLDEKTGDLASSVPILAGISSYAIFPSLPKRLVDNLHYFYLERGLIAGCVGADITSPLDNAVVELTGWILIKN